MESSSDIILLITVGSGLMLLLAMAFVLFFSFSQNKMRKEQFKAQEAKLEYQENLLHSTILTQEKERKRIAKDLHDEVGSKLNVINLFLHQLTKKAPEVQTNISEIREVLNDTIDTSRRISHDLLPPTLENFGLEAAVDELGDMIRQTSELGFDLEVQGERPAGDHTLVELNLFRILQELVSNTLKYAHAQQIEVALYQSREQLVLEYKDNGQGFEQDKFENQKGMGMKNIESRLQMVKGTYELKTSPGAGMKIRMLVNIPETTAEEIKA